MLDKTLAECGVAHFIEPHRLPRRDLDHAAIDALALSRSTKNLIPQIDLLQDRRRTRYSRLRKAVEQGLEQPQALQLKRKDASVDSEAVDPQLDEVAKRLTKRRTRA